MLSTLLGALGAIAAIAAFVLMLFAIQFPTVYGLSFSADKDSDGTPCGILSFTFSTTIPGCHIESISLDGFVLVRLSQTSLVSDRANAVSVLKNVFTTTPGNQTAYFLLKCFPVAPVELPRLKIHWRKSFMRRTTSTPVSAATVMTSHI